MKKQKINWKILILCFVTVYLIAFLGSIFTSKNVDSEWYNSIRPSLTPPNWVFPVVWNILFFLIALSLYFLIISKKKTKKKALIFFGINLFLNLLWSFLFFFLKNPVLAFFDLILLWLSILGIVYFSWKINRKISYLLIPYFLWISFAGVLNFLIAFT